MALVYRWLGPNEKLIFVALSGHLFAPPSVDENTLPP
jgi:hypothetical protein